MKHAIKVPNFMGLTKKVLHSRMVIGRVESLKHFKDSFIKQGFNDSGFQPWKKSRHPFMGKRTLLNTNSLMNSIECTSQSVKRVLVETKKSYAETHNNGATITVTERMKKYFWWQYRIHSERVQRTKKGNVYKGKANQSTNSKAEFCKAMALRKVGSKIKIPKRQFMGNSKNMMGKMDSALLDYAKREFNKLGNK